MTNLKTPAQEITQEVVISLLKDQRQYCSDRGDVAASIFGIAQYFPRRMQCLERAYQSLPPGQALEALSPDLTPAPGAPSPEGRVI
jgi:hypothetical protein